MVRRGQLDGAVERVVAGAADVGVGFQLRVERGFERGNVEWFVRRAFQQRLAVAPVDRSGVVQRNAPRATEPVVLEIAGVGGGQARRVELHERLAAQVACFGFGVAFAVDDGRCEDCRLRVRRQQIDPQRPAQAVVAVLQLVAPAVPTAQRVARHVVEHPARAAVHAGLVDRGAEQVVPEAHDDAPGRVRVVHHRIAHFPLVAVDVEFDARRRVVFLAVECVARADDAVVVDAEEGAAERVEVRELRRAGMRGGFAGGVGFVPAEFTGVPLRVPGAPTGVDAGEVAGDEVPDVGVAARVGQHRVVAVPRGLRPRADHHLLVALVRVQRGDHAADRVVEQHGADTGFDAKLERRAVGEKRLVLSDRPALVVEDGPATGDPTWVAWRAGLHLLLDLAAQAVETGQAVLDAAVLAFFQVADMHLARQGVQEHRLRLGKVLAALVGEGVDHDAAGGTRKQRVCFRQRVVLVRGQRVVVQVGLDAVEAVAQSLFRLAHARRRNHLAQRVEHHRAAVAVRVHQSAGLQHAVVDARARGVDRTIGPAFACRGAVAQRVARIDGQQVVRVVDDHALGRCGVGVERVAGAVRQEEVAPGPRQFVGGAVAGGGRNEHAAGWHPRVAVAVKVAVTPGRQHLGGLRQQQLPVANEGVAQQARREREAVTFAGHRTRFQRVQRQQGQHVVARGAQVVGAVERAAALRQAHLRACAVRGLLESQALSVSQGGEAVAGPVVQREAAAFVARMKSGEFEGLRTRRHRVAVVVPWPLRLIDGVGVCVLGVRDKRAGLLVAVGLQGQRGVRAPSAVADRHRTQHVAEAIDLQRLRVLHAGVGRVALALAGDRLAWVREEHGEAVAPAWLHQAHAEVLLGDGVGVRLARRTVERVDLGAQRRAFQRTAGLAHFIEAEPLGQHGVGQDRVARLHVGEARLAVVLAGVAGVERTREVVRHTCAAVSVAAEDAGMEPGLRQHRRQLIGGARIAGVRQRSDVLRVPLIDTTEAAELAFQAVVVPVVVRVPRDEPVAADAVERLDPFEPRAPGTAVW